MLRRKQKQQQEVAAPSAKGAAPRSRALQEDTALEQVVLGRADDAFKAAIGDPEGPPKAKKTKKKAKTTEVQAAVWQDEDDQALRINVARETRLRKLRKNEGEEELRGDEYARRLRQQFSKIHGKPAWAEAKARGEGEDGGLVLEEEPEASELLQSSSRLVSSTHGGHLRGGTLDVARVVDANRESRSQAVVQAIQFHPSAPAMLTAGLDKTLRVFQIDGKRNVCLQSTYLKDLPIYSAAFTPDGNEIIMSGRRKYFYSFDLESGAVNRIAELHGKEERSLQRMAVSPDGSLIAFSGGTSGSVVLVSRKTKHWVGELKMNTMARNFVFSPDGRRLISSGDDSKMYIWDVGTRRCEHTFEDEGCIHSDSMAIAPNGSYFAAGSDSGVVNLYDMEHCLAQAAPKPLKAFLNLATPIDTLRFNHDSNMLLFGSKMAKQAVRIVHVPSRTVFKNWPFQGANLGYVHSAAFSPASGYVALGNAHGEAPLFRLKHYGSF